MNFADIAERALADAIANGVPVLVVFRTVGAGPSEIPPDVLARWPEALPILFSGDGTVRNVSIADGAVIFEAPFYSTIGRSAWLALQTSRILSIQSAAPQRERTPPPAPSKDRRGLSAVRGAA